MADGPKNVAASVKQRLLNLARAQGRGFDILLVRFALERLLFRLSQSAHRDNYVLKGGMLVTQWLDHENRETRDADFLGFGDADAEKIKAIFAEIMAVAGDDGLDFDTSALTPAISLVATRLGFAADDDGWIQLFNGKDLTDWTPKIRGYELGDNYGNTFRVEDGVMEVGYDKYDKFDEKFLRHDFGAALNQDGDLVCEDPPIYRLVPKGPLRR